jgi:histidine triad (HIT) family protein
MSCLFCEIASGAREAALVWSDEQTVAFLDHRPLFPGHVLLIPRAHTATLADLPGADAGHFLQTIQKLERAVEAAMQADGTFIAVNNRVSQSVPHLHVHIVPRRKGDGLKGFFWPRHPYRDDSEMESVAARIRNAVSG